MTQAIVEDIDRINNLQDLNLKPENSIRFIMEDGDEDFIGGYNLSRFRMLCRWEDLIIDSSKNDEIGLFELSEEFIYKFAEDIGWYKLSRNIRLTEEFIEKHQTEVNWSMLSQFQYLSEEFIDKFKDKVSWSKISIGQTHMSEEFIWKYRNKLSINNIIIFNKNLSYEFKERLKPLRW